MRLIRFATAERKGRTCDAKSNDKEQEGKRFHPWAIKLWKREVGEKKISSEVSNKIVGRQ